MLFLNIISTHICSIKYNKYIYNVYYINFTIIEMGIDHQIKTGTQ